MTIRDLSQEDSICQTFVAELRDVEIQKDPLRFRRNLERIGEVMAYEISKSLPFEDAEVTTPLGHASYRKQREQPVIASILRAGLTMHQGLLSYFDRADNAFISAFRKHHGAGDIIEVEVEYLASPALEGRTVILCDPMLATGSSLALTYQGLLEKGQPNLLFVACAIASQPGIEYLEDKLPNNTHVICGAIDPSLDNMSYIVPGLGDAGDMAYGIKA